MEPAAYFAPPELLLPPVELPEVPPVPPLVPPVELSGGGEPDVPPVASPPVEPPDALLPVSEAPELDEPEGLLPDMSPPPDVPPVEAPLLVLPVSDEPPLVPPGGGVLLAPPLVPPGGGELVPPDGGVLGEAPGVSDGGGVDDDGVDELGGLLVAPVPPWSPPPLPPRLQAATLIVSKPIRIRIFEACSLEFIAIPFNKR